VVVYWLQIKAIKCSQHSTTSQKAYYCQQAAQERKLATLLKINMFFLIGVVKKIKIY